MFCVGLNIIESILNRLTPHPVHSIQSIFKEHVENSQRGMQEEVQQEAQVGPGRVVSPFGQVSIAWLPGAVVQLFWYLQQLPRGAW